MPCCLEISDPGLAAHEGGDGLSRIIRHYMRGEGRIIPNDQYFGSLFIHILVCILFRNARSNAYEHIVCAQDMP